MVAQQLHGLVDEFGFLFPSRRFIAPAQLLQNLYSGRLTHVFIHSGQGNPTFGTTNGLSRFLTPSRVTKLLAQFAAVKDLDISMHLRRGYSRMRVSYHERVPG